MCVKFILIIFQFENIIITWLFFNNGWYINFFDFYYISVKMFEIVNLLHIIKLFQFSKVEIWDIISLMNFLYIFYIYKAFISHENTWSEYNLTDEKDWYNYENIV